MGNSIKEVQERMALLDARVSAIEEVINAMIEHDRKKTAEPKAKTSTKTKTLKEQ